MNPERRPSYQIKECIRLASYRVDGERLYADQEIAESLGESPEWVANIVGATRPTAPVSQITNMTYDTAAPPRPFSVPCGLPTTITTYQYDASHTPLLPVNADSQITNMTYDSAAHFRTSAVQGGLPMTVTYRYDTGERLRPLNPGSQITNMTFDSSAHTRLYETHEIRTTYTYDPREPE